MIPVKYIGKRPIYRDGVYNTGITWAAGQTLLLPDEQAKKLLRHADVYVLGSANAKPAILKDNNVAIDAERTLQDARDLIAGMEKDALVDYAKNNYRIDIDKRLSVPKLRAKVTGLIEQYGVC